MTPPFTFVTAAGAVFPPIATRHTWVEPSCCGPFTLRSTNRAEPSADHFGCRSLPRSDVSLRGVPFPSVVVTHRSERRLSAFSSHVASVYATIVPSGDTATSVAVATLA